MKGVCCAAQAAGDLGKPLVITIHRKDGTTRRACGVCETVPSCRDPQKVVFAFRFLKNSVCSLPGATKCTPTPAGIAQYNSAIGSAGQGSLPFAVDYSSGRPLLYQGVTTGSPYQLPPS